MHQAPFTGKSISSAYISPSRLVYSLPVQRLVTDPCLGAGRWETEEDQDGWLILVTSCTLGFGSLMISTKLGFPGQGKLGVGERSGQVGTHSSILAWEIPWTEKPGGLQSMGVRVRHDSAAKQQVVR